VTVCVAAIAEMGGDRLILGASDRMVTAGDIEFEQEQKKIHILTTSIAIMVAGDLCVIGDILHEVNAWRDQQIADFPTDWLKVKNTADRFNEALLKAKREAAKNAILVPLALDYADLTSGAVSTELAMQLSKEVYEYQFPVIEALVTGIDPSGAHIYSVDGVKGVCCQDWLGFAAIGYGAPHASSQLMFAGHVKNRNFAETLMLLYSSKRRAEVAPGVGEETDMFAIGPGIGNVIDVGEPLMTELEKTYQASKKQAEKVRTAANAKITRFFQVPTGATPVQSQSNRELETGSIGAQEGGTEANGETAATQIEATPADARQP